MTQTHPLPSYTELAEALQGTDSTCNPAEAHGIICGLICATSGELAKDWQKMIVGPKKDAHCSNILQDLMEASYHEMSDFSFEFSLVLPDDSIDINARTETLGLWCQGFLTGLQQSSTPIEEFASDDVNDALNDIVEIAQVNYGDISDTDEDETAYYELVEYVRLVVLMVYHEMNNTESIASDDDDENEDDDEDHDNDDRDSDNIDKSDLLH